MLNVYIGYDPREAVAYHVCAHSILSRASGPVAIIPINKRNIPEYTREMEDGSTEFSFSRFLTPYLSGYVGQSIFMDSDMLVLDNVYSLIEECSLFVDVSVVKHDYTPKTTTKFLGNKQHVYPKKNWSSVMVFNNYTSPCRSLSPIVVNESSGKYLHQFEWTNEDRIGELSKDWNHLVGEYDENPNAKIVHFTLGTPCFKGYEDQEYADAWFKEKEAMNYAHN